MQHHGVLKASVLGLTLAVVVYQIIMRGIRVEETVHERWVRSGHFQARASKVTPDEVAECRFEASRFVGWERTFFDFQRKYLSSESGAQPPVSEPASASPSFCSWKGNDSVVLNCPTHFHGRKARTYGFLRWLDSQSHYPSGDERTPLIEAHVGADVQSVWCYCEQEHWYDFWWVGTWVSDVLELVWSYGSWTFMRTLDDYNVQLLLRIPPSPVNGSIAVEKEKNRSVDRWPHVQIVMIDSMGFMDLAAYFLDTLAFLSRQSQWDVYELGLLSTQGLATMANVEPMFSGVHARHDAEAIEDHRYHAADSDWLLQLFHDHGFLTCFARSTCHQYNYAPPPEGCAAPASSKSKCKHGVDWDLHEPACYADSLAPLLLYQPGKHVNVGGRSLSHHQLKYLNLCAGEANRTNRRSFAVAAVADAHEPTHRRVRLLDMELAAYLESADSQSLIVILSDHGINYGPHGLSEGDHRFAFFLFPKGSLSASEAQHMHSNQYRLTTSVDIYKTLAAIAGKQFQHDNDVLNRRPNGYNLLRESIPTKRTCNEAGLPDRYCLCKSPI